MSNNWSYWRSSCNCFHALNKGWPKQQAVRSCQQVPLPLASTCTLQTWWSPHGHWSRFVCSAPSCFAATTSALHAWHFRNSWKERSRPAVLPWFSGFPESTQSTHCWSNRHKLKKIPGAKQPGAEDNEEKQFLWNTSLFLHSTGRDTGRVRKRLC